MKAQYLSSWVTLVPSRNHIQEVGSPLAIVVKRPVETIGSRLTARCATRGRSLGALIIGDECETLFVPTRGNFGLRTSIHVLVALLNWGIRSHFTCQV